MVFMLINSHAANYSKKHCQSFDCAQYVQKLWASDLCVLLSPPGAFICLAEPDNYAITSGYR